MGTRFSLSLSLSNADDLGLGSESRCFFRFYFFLTALRFGRDLLNAFLLHGRVARVPGGDDIFLIGRTTSSYRIIVYAHRQRYVLNIDRDRITARCTTPSVDWKIKTRKQTQLARS